MASIEDTAECGERTDALVSGVLARVMRQRRSIATAVDYVRALSRETRANCWELAEKAGHAGPHRMQALLRRCKWAWQELRAELPVLAAACLPDDPDDLIGLEVGETADLRKGSSTARVAPQHAGVTGKAENCVTWVFAALVTAFGQAWVDFDVSRPASWAKDPDRGKKAGIPGGLVFVTKPELAAEQVKRLVSSGIRVLRAAADEVYGRCGDFRDALRPCSLAYVVIVPCSQTVMLAKGKTARAGEAMAGAVFERRSCGNGEKGPRYADWALIGLAGPREFLLVRRLERTAEPPPPAPPPPTVMTLQIPLTSRSVLAVRRCPGQPASPARPASPRSPCRTPGPAASCDWPANGRSASSPPAGSRSISAGQHGGAVTRPAPAGTTTPPASPPSLPEPGQLEGGDAM
jgi:hypothetical protein